MKRLLALAFAAALAVLTTGCATVSGSPNQTVSILTKNQNGEDVSEAKCQLNNDKGRWYLTTPGSTMVQRSNEDMRIVCEKAGHDTGRKNIVSEVKGAMYGNIILGGGVGAIIDHANGSAYEYPAIVHIDMPALTPDEIAARAAKAAAEKAANEAAAAAAAAERAADALPRAMVPLAIATGRKPQKGDEWEYLAMDKLYGKQKTLVWRVKSVESSGVIEELMVDGMPKYQWTFDSKPTLVVAPTDAGFLLGQHWNDGQIPTASMTVKGNGECVVRYNCRIEAKVVGFERITVPAGTFDTIRIDGRLSVQPSAVYTGNVSFWYSEKNRRLIKQTANVRAAGFNLDETVELQFARSIQ